MDKTNYIRKGLVSKDHLCSWYCGTCHQTIGRWAVYDHDKDPGHERTPFVGTERVVELNDDIFIDEWGTPHHRKCNEKEMD